MEENLSQSLRKYGKRINTIHRDGIILAEQITKFYKGKTVEIEVFRAKPPLCQIRYPSETFLERKKVVGQITHVEFHGTHGDLMVVYFQNGPDDYLKNRIETNISNLKSIKIVKK